MTDYAFAARPTPSVAIDGSELRFPVRRIFCVGRNYREHAREMGGDPARDIPFFFTKPADALVASGEEVPYPSRTANFHHEVELVVAVGRGGRDIAAADAVTHLFGYAVGNDLTRRDLQLAARAKGQPWDSSKGFDHSAVVGMIRPVERGHLTRGRIWLAVNDNLRQNADVADMTWNVPEIIAELSGLFELAAGDLIFTGTPAGVGQLARGDRIEAGIEGLGSISNRIV